MIQDKNSAYKVNKMMLNIGKDLDQSITDIQDYLSESELNKYKLAIGKVMSEMLFEIMNPIYEEHPELIPQELKPL